MSDTAVVADKEHEWSKIRAIIHYNYLGKHRAQELQITKKELEEQYGTSLTPENFQKQVLEFMDATIHNSILERGSKSNVYVILPPTAITHIELVVEDIPNLIVP